MPAPLNADEREGIVLAAQGVFTKLRNLYAKVEAVFDAYGFTPPSAGVIARDLSEKIEIAITQHCSTFSKGVGHADLSRDGENWEVKICKGGGLTINQSKLVAGEHYIVVNYTSDTRVSEVWVLWSADDSFFSPRKPNTNARSLLKTHAAAHIEVLLKAKPSSFSATPAKAAKASIPGKNKAQAS